MARRPTMADVARRAGVSKMTVSRVVNDLPGVSAAAQARVRRAVAALGYVPSQRGRSLAVGRSHLLGMIVLNITSEWVWPLILGAGEAAEALGYQLLLRTTGAGEVASFNARRPAFGGDLVDGLLIVSWVVPVAFARELSRRRFPVVLVDAFTRPRSVNWVSSEDRAGARAAVAHLAGLGHRAIGFVGGGERAYLARQRLAGFRDGVRDWRLSARAAPVAHGDFSRESGCLAARRLLSGRARPTALLAANDAMAVGALDAAQELGLRVPRDLSLVGFDDTPIAAHVNPPLTSVRRPYRAIGETAARLLVDAVAAETGRQSARQIDLPTELVVRASTAPPGRG